MGDIYCYYHTDRNAISKCQNCGKYLCVECKQIYAQTHSSSSSRSMIKELCPACNVEQVNKTYNPLLGICPCLMFIIFLISIFVMGGFEGMPTFFIVALVIMGLLIFWTVVYQFVIKGTNEKIKAQELSERIVKGSSDRKVEVSQQSTENIKESNQKALYCRFCGAPIQINSNSCQYCGMTWIWK